jgi:hypothetical protein
MKKMKVGWFSSATYPQSNEVIREFSFAVSKANNSTCMGIRGILRMECRIYRRRQSRAVGKDRQRSLRSTNPAAGDGCGVFL